jgi:NADH dehydrogenase
MEATLLKRVVIVGWVCGYQLCEGAGGHPGLKVTLIDRRNYHLFQPLLYQVAMAGLSPCDIATPIRGLMAHHANVHVVQGEVRHLDIDARAVDSDAGRYAYDYLVLATGAQHAYFGKERWESMRRV